MSFKKGDSVSVHYIGKLEDGSIFESSEGQDPLEFVIGAEDLMPKFEEALLGKKSGDIVEVVLLPEDAHGERDEDLIYDVPKDLFDDINSIEVGSVLTQEEDEDEELVEAIVVAINEDSITIDENHPLAGKKLFFTITIQ